MVAGRGHDDDPGPAAGRSNVAVMRVEVNTELCQGHNRCYALAPELFDVDDYGTAVVIGDGSVAPELEEKAQLAGGQLPRVRDQHQRRLTRVGAGGGLHPSPSTICAAIASITWATISERGGSPGKSSGGSGSSPSPMRWKRSIATSTHSGCGKIQ